MSGSRSGVPKVGHRRELKCEMTKNNFQKFLFCSPLDFARSTYTFLSLSVIDRMSAEKFRASRLDLNW